ncbi:ABC transporter permease [Haloferax sp. Atlit-4N]|uniref:ABC transporter permease n=1 Tax=Haloferax sp. Atlit-4N TaxID=2077206 RepID=UPI000E2575F7|nr:ABC transporter permease [Haloferax sp. Atlit-4N]RDZ51339.1 ABC transporter permease [Haloferax sp. Atlit-4N]
MKLTDFEIQLTESNPDKMSHRSGVEEIFGIKSGVEDGSRSQELTRKERYYRLIDAYALVPLRIMWNDWRARLGFSIMAIFVFMATVWSPMYPKVYRNAAPILVRPFNPEYTQYIFRFSLGGFTFNGIEVWRYPLGTDGVGRPLLARIVNAAPDMAQLVFAGAVVSIALAVIIGTAAGYFGGTVDDVLMGLTDIVLTIPGLPLIILLTAIIEPNNMFVLGMLLAIDNWPGLARSLRSQVLTIRQESYVEAARAMGMSKGDILGKDIVPQLMPFIMINAAGAGKGVITEAVGLYFLGFLPGDAPNWGKMMDNAWKGGAIQDPTLFYWMLAPMIVLAGLSFGLVMLAQGMDQLFNPRLRARHAKTVGGDEDLDGPAE